MIPPALSIFITTSSFSFIIFKIAVIASFIICEYLKSSTLLKLFFYFVFLFIFVVFVVFPSFVVSYFIFACSFFRHFLSFVALVVFAPLVISVFPRPPFFLSFPRRRESSPEAYCNFLLFFHEEIRRAKSFMLFIFLRFLFLGSRLRGNDKRGEGMTSGTVMTRSVGMARGMRML